MLNKKIKKIKCWKMPKITIIFPTFSLKISINNFPEQKWNSLSFLKKKINYKTAIWINFYHNNNEKKIFFFWRTIFRELRRKNVFPLNQKQLQLALKATYEMESRALITEKKWIAIFSNWIWSFFTWLFFWECSWMISRISWLQHLDNVTL